MVAGKNGQDSVFIINVRVMDYTVQIQKVRINLIYPLWCSVMT